jgi:uncharacterized protein YndB with AHSA1/START domain
MNPTDASDTIVQEITIKAPAERIFEALTNPDQRLKWWGAEGQYRGTARVRALTIKAGLKSWLGCKHT